MSSSRSFIWIPSTTAGGSVSTNNGTTIYNSNATIKYTTGDTIIQNNSLTTNELTVTTIQGTSNAPVAFPDGVKSPNIYYTNAYEYAAGTYMNHHNRVNFLSDVYASAPLHVDTIASNNLSLLTIGQSVHITGSLSVTGASTALSSLNTTFADRYITLNNGYTGTGLSSGLISINSTTSAYPLSGSFSGLTVGTLAASGFNPGDIITISGSTSNNGVFQVQTHAANVLTISSSPQSFCSGSFTSEAAVGTARLFTMVGLEFSSAGAPVYMSGSNTISRRNIAYDTSSPVFTDVTCDTAVVNNVLADNTLTNILVLAADGKLKKRTMASIVSATPTYTATTATFLPTMTGCGVITADNILASLQIRRDPVVNELQTHALGSFTFVTVTAGSTIYLTAGISSYLSNYKIFHDVLLNWSGLHEMCMIVHDRVNERYIITRKNGSVFPAGVSITHGMIAFAPVGSTMLSSWTFSVY